jgi:LuxR family transcriptional regulator, maltose regulon positive regulatory protein
VELPGRGDSPHRAELRRCRPALRSAGGIMLEAIVPRILQELESTDREIVLVLDDYHWVTNPACHDSTALLVERRPANVQLVVSSRLDPPLGFARLGPAKK